MVLSWLVFVSLYEGDELLKYFSLFFSYVYIEKIGIGYWENVHFNGIHKSKGVYKSFN